MRALRVIFPVLLAFLLVSSISAMAYNWWEAAASAGTGAVVGGTAGLFVGGPLGALAGAGIGALAGFIGNTIGQLLPQAPTFSDNPSDWRAYAEDVYAAVAPQAQLVADNEINQVNLLEQSQPVFVETAQKWEQVNFNIQTPPTSPYEFYEMLQQTGYISYVAKLIGGQEYLWIELQNNINSINNQIQPHGYRIAFNTFPNNSVTVNLNQLPNPYVLIVIGNVVVSEPYNTKLGIFQATPNGTQLYTVLTTGQQVALTSGAYVANTTLAVTINPNNGTALLFEYGYTSYSAWNWNYNRPSNIVLWSGVNTLNSTNLPAPNGTLPYVAEEIAVSMLGAAETEYTTLQKLGFESAAQIPLNYTLPAIELNVGNFTPYNSSLQAYNLYMAMYSRQLLQMAQTLQQLQEQGRLQGLQQLVFNATNPLELYGQYGGFIANGSIILPNGQRLNGLYLIQPYGGPLTLSSNGGVVGSGGAVAYQLVPTQNGYALGTMYTLPPGTAVQGNVLNPGTLGTYNQPQKADYLNETTPTPPFSSSPSSSAALNSIENYLLSHPLVLIGTGLFVLIILVALIRALL
jgi:hypothetical protein